MRWVGGGRPPVVLVVGLLLGQINKATSNAILAERRHERKQRGVNYCS